MGRLETEAPARGTSYFFELPDEPTSVKAVQRDRSVVPPAVLVATEDQVARRAAVVARGTEFALGSLVRVA